MEQNKNMGYCPLKSIGKQKDVACNEYCSWFVKGFGKCIVHAINSNLSRLKGQ